MKTVAEVLAAIEAASSFTENEEVLAREVVRLHDANVALSAALRDAQQDYASAAHKLEHARRLCAEERAKCEADQRDPLDHRHIPVWVLDLEATLNGGAIAL